MPGMSFSAMALSSAGLPLLAPHQRQYHAQFLTRLSSSIASYKSISLALFQSKLGPSENLNALAF